MSRSGYSDDYEYNDWSLICWRGAVKSAIKGKRGQAFLKEMLDALDALPEKKLIKNDLIDETGSVCAIGAVGKIRNVDMKQLDPEYPEDIAKTFGIARAMVQEIEYMNDEAVWAPVETPEQRFDRMRQWVVDQIKE